MDLFLNMHNLFEDEIWKDLGPVDPNWFEKLTAETCVFERKVSDQDELCANQEGIFKEPLEKSVVESQLFSTPKVFRQSHILSPETEDDPPSIVQQEKVALPWMETQSPCLFQDSKVEVLEVKSGSLQSQNESSFDFLTTPKKSSASYDRQISESLGAQLNPDFSWTSSMNTPPLPLPSTLILSKPAESPCSASDPSDKNVILVQKLFSSLSKNAKVGEAKSNDVLSVSQDAERREANKDSSISLHHSEDIPKGNTSDEGLQSTEGGVPIKTENFSSMLSDNSSSALREVKPGSNKRKRNVLTDESGSEDVSSQHSIASGAMETFDAKPSKIPTSPPVKTDIEVSQWSPLNLLEIPPNNAEVNVEELQNDNRSEQLVRPSIKIPESTLIKKRRAFVYTVRTSKPQVLEELPQYGKTGSSSNITESGQNVTINQKKPQNGANFARTGKDSVKKQLKFYKETLQDSAKVLDVPTKVPDVPANVPDITANVPDVPGKVPDVPGKVPDVPGKVQDVPGKVQGVDMSQLCRDFAQDFSQMSDCGNQMKVAKNIFSPSACLSALKQAKQKAKQAEFHHNLDGTSMEKTSMNNRNDFLCEHSKNDSGFQSCISNTTALISSCDLPSTEKAGPSQEWCGFKADMDETTPSSTEIGNEKVSFEITLTSGNSFHTKQACDLEVKRESHSECTSARQQSSVEMEEAFDNTFCVPAASLPSGPASGFKTASNKAFHITPTNLEKAKSHFDEAESEKNFSDQSTKHLPADIPKSCVNKCSDLSKASGTEQPPLSKKTTTSQLTASQRADVTEICSLLEEAGTQFEFTQFRAAKIKEHCEEKSNSPLKPNKEIDPDFLAGIDFDDSFNCDDEDPCPKNVTPNKMTPWMKNQKHIGISNTKSGLPDVSSSSTLEEENCSLPSGSCNTAKNGSYTPKLEKTGAGMLEVAFKSAGENILRVSKKCLSKAKTLFGDLEENALEKSTIRQKSHPEIKEKCNMAPNMCTFKHSRHIEGELQDTEESVCSAKQITSTGFGGFHMASGKEISISADYMQKANAVFKDCDTTDHPGTTTCKTTTKRVTGTISNMKSVERFNNTSEGYGKTFKRFQKVERVVHHTKEPRVQVEKSSNCTLAFRSPLPSLQHTTSKNIDPSVVDEWSAGDGFHKASGEKVSAEATKKAEHLLGDIHLTETNKETEQKEISLIAEQQTAQVLPPKSRRFQTTSGKEVAISESKYQINSSPTCSKVQFTGPPAIQSGFSSASGKPLACSSEALQKAQALFSDVSLSPDTSAVSDTKRSIERHKDAEKNMRSINCPFKIVKGAAIRVSKKSLSKTKHLLKQFDDLPSTNKIQEAEVSVPQCDADKSDSLLTGNKKANVCWSDDNEKKFHPNQSVSLIFSEDRKHGCREETKKGTLKESMEPAHGLGFQMASDKTVALSAEALKKAKALLDECKEVKKTSATPLQSRATAPPLRRSVFHSASKKPVAVSSEALQKAKSHTGNIALTADASDFSLSKNNERSGGEIEKKNFGFNRTGGDKVHVSKESLLKTKHVFQEIDASTSENTVQEQVNKCPEDTKKVKQKESIAPSHGVGFQMASGKAVALSAEALKKAKALLDECEGVKKMSETPLQSRATAPPLKRAVFHSTSKKLVGVSSEALEKTKSHVHNIASTAVVPDFSFSKNNEKSSGDAENRSFGFASTEEEKVHVSKESLPKAKHVFQEFDASCSENTPQVLENGCPEDTNNGKQKGSIAPSHGVGFQMASGKTVALSAEALKKAKALFDESEGVKNMSEAPIKFKATTPPARGAVFHSTCKKSAAVSSVPIQKGKSHIRNMALIAQVPDVSLITNGEKIGGDAAKRCLGVASAGEAKVQVSKESLLKAKHVFQKFDASTSENTAHEQENEYPEDTKNGKQKKSLVPSHGVGFQMASGKTIALSVEALKKAKALLALDECEGVKRISEGPLQFKAIAPPLKDAVFHSTCKKPEAVSSETFQKAKSHIDNIDLTAEVPDVLLRENIEKSGGETEKINFSFNTAGGAKVHVSKESLLQSKHVFQEIDASTSENTAQEQENECPGDTKNGKQKESIAPSHGVGFQMASGKTVALSAEALKKAKALLDECEGVKKMSETPLKSRGTAPPLKSAVFHSACKKPVAVSSEDPQKVKVHFDDIDFTAEISDVSLPKNNEKSGGDAEKRSFGFTTAGGTKVHVSKESLLKTKHVFQEIDASTLDNSPEEAENKNSMNGSEQFNPKHQGGGILTTSSKAAAVSSEALKREKSMLGDNKEAKIESVVSSPQVWKTLAGPVPKNGGFSSASGKPVSFSSEALQKAKTLFGDIGLHSEKHTDSDVCSEKNHEKRPHETEIKTFGFSTAGGRKVTVSEESLANATNLLRELDDKDHQQLDSEITNPHQLESDLPNANNVGKKSYSSLHADNEEIPANEEASYGSKPCPSLEMNYVNKSMESLLTDVWTCQDDQIVPAVAQPVESHVLDCDLTKAFGVESSDLNLQSMNLTDCTATQHKFLVQEALDCTKALLEDESLSNQSLFISSNNKMSQHKPEDNDRSSEEEKVRKKRPIRDADMSDQPPLKRQLLEEFDRAVDGSKGFSLRPVKSSPNDFLTNRAIFSVGTFPQPNVIKPNRDGKSFMVVNFSSKKAPTEYSAAAGSKPAQSKTATFVPPFIKNTETAKPPILKEKLNTPVFVPPYKKQKTLQENTTEKKEEQCQQTCQANINPPASPAPTDDSANSSGTNNRSVCVGGQEVCGDAEASQPHDESSEDQDINQDLQNIELARDMQDMRIRKKNRQNIRPLPGSLFLTKTSGLARIPLKMAAGGKLPTRSTCEQLYKYGVQSHVSEVCSETAEAFRFNLLQFTRQEAILEGGGIQLADGGWLIPHNDWTAGKEEFYRALCDTPGVDPKLISEAWVYNHYRWIVWKQACMEQSFPETMGRFCLTPDQILLQLKYRYDVEVDNSLRPALRKIMEKDDTEAKTLVLCVSEVVTRGKPPSKQIYNNNKTPQTADTKVETSSAVIWLTDGWYAIKAQLDEPLTAMLHRGLLAVGGKLIITGAQIVGSQEACSPLEAPESLILKLCINSCRRARWDAKLGFYKDPRPFRLPLCSLYSNGGPVGCVDVVILRSYPIQWMEKKADGGVVFRSCRSEEKEARRYNNLKQKAMEMLFAKIQAEFEKEEKGKIKPQRRKQLSHQNIKSLQDGEELYEAIGDDSTFYETHLSEQQVESLHSYKCLLMEKKHAELQDRYRRAMEAEDNETICPKRNVAPVWRICIADSLAESTRVYQLNIWRPSPDLQSLLREGNRYKVYNLITSDGKKRKGIESIQLTGSKKTQFQDLQVSQDWLSAYFQPRVSTDFMNLQNTEFRSLCGEVDLTGYVISVKDEQGSSPSFYLTDEKLNFVKVRCFSSLCQANLEDLIKPGVLLALTNLQLRGQSMYLTPVVYAGDLTGFSTNPKEVHLQESINHLRNQVQDQENFFLNAEEKLTDLVKSDVPNTLSSPALQPQTPASAADSKQDSKTNEMHLKPNKNFGSFTPVSKNTPAGTPSTDKDPRYLKRRRALDYLSRIPSPPQLSHLNSFASPCVNKTFNPPRKSRTPSTLQTEQTPVKKPSNSVGVGEWVNDEELAMIDTQHLHAGDFKVAT